MTILWAAVLTAQADDDVARWLQTEAAWEAAWTAQDVSAIEALIAPDYAGPPGVDARAVLAFAGSADPPPGVFQTTGCTAMAAGSASAAVGEVVWSCPDGPVRVAYHLQDDRWLRAGVVAAWVDTGGPQLPSTSERPIVVQTPAGPRVRFPNDHQQQYRVQVGELPVRARLALSRNDASTPVLPAGTVLVANGSDGQLITPEPVSPLVPCDACTQAHASAAVRAAAGLRWVEPGLAASLLAFAGAEDPTPPHLTALSAEAPTHGLFRGPRDQPSLALHPVGEGAVLRVDPSWVRAEASIWAAQVGKVKLQERKDGFALVHRRKTLVRVTLGQRGVVVDLAGAHEQPPDPRTLAWLPDLPLKPGPLDVPLPRALIPCGESCIAGSFYGDHPLPPDWAKPLLACLVALEPTTDPPTEGVPIRLTTSQGPLDLQIGSTVSIPGEGTWAGACLQASSPYLQSMRAGERARQRLSIKRMRKGSTWSGLLEDTDGWGNPFRSVDETNTVMSLGRDGAPGGEGPDADFTVSQAGVAFLSPVP